MSSSASGDTTKFQVGQVALQDLGQPLLDFARGKASRSTSFVATLLSVARLFGDWRFNGVPRAFICWRIWPIARQPQHPHCPRRASHLPRDVFEGQPFAMAEHEHFAIVGGKFGQVVGQLRPTCS